MPESLLHRLRNTASKLGGDVTEHTSERAFIALCKFRSSCAARLERSRDTGILCVGDPIHPRRAIPSIQASLEVMVRELSNLDLSSVGRLRGQFAACYWCFEQERLVLFNDALGVRPIYLAQLDGGLLFSTNFRALSSLVGSNASHTPDTILQLIAFGAPLDDRTRHPEISLLPVGKAMVLSEDAQTLCTGERPHYGTFNGTDIAILATQLNDRFADAVQVRAAGLGTDSMLAFLSGGMDSRAIVAKLSQLGHSVRTLNVAPPGTLDAVLGTSAAHVMQTEHHVFDFTQLGAGLDVMLRKGVAAVSKPSSEHGRQPRFVWSGDGGSVSLGAVYLTREIVALAERCEWNPVAGKIIEALSGSLPLRCIRAKHRALAAEMVGRSVATELANLAQSGTIPREVPLQFLMRTDQRKHLHAFYSEMVEGDYEPILPFFDVEFNSWLAAIPVDIKLYHELYHVWYVSGALDPAQTTPWQTYPGHRSCPLPLPTNATSQWENSTSWYTKSMQRSRARTVSKRVLLPLLTGAMHTEHLNRPFSLFAVIATLMGFERWRYIPFGLSRLLG